MAKIQLVMFDVDGTLTNGLIFYDYKGRELKGFFTKDGSRMTLPAASGARTSSTLATVMRNGELKIYFGIEFR